MTNSNEYEAARTAHNAAQAVFEKVTAAYRAIEIGDDEYMVGRAAYDEATAIFDVAFAAEADQEEEAPIEIEDNQMSIDFG